MLDLTNKTVLVYDFGLCVSHALRLARDFKTVYYFCPWQDAFPKFINGLIGRGYENENMVRVLDFWAYVDKVDIIVFFDTYCGDLVNYLKLKGYRVFGAGLESELENDRWYSRKIQQKSGLPTQETHKIIGLENLRVYLQDKVDKVVKLNAFRGALETFIHINYKSSQPLLDHLATELGPIQTQIEFVVEDKVGIIEPGYDGYIIDGKFPNKGLFAYEMKGSGYVAAVQDYTNIPKSVKLINDGLSSSFAKYKARTLYSSEVRVDEQGVGYLIDNTIRAGMPGPSSVMMEIFENFSEIIYNGAMGIMTQPDIKYKYGCAVGLDSGWADEHWLEVEVPEDIRKYVKLRKHIKVEDKYYAVPGFSSLCAVIGLGETLEQAIQDCKDRIEQISAYQIEKNTSGLDSIIDSIKQGEELGLKFFS